MSRMTDYYEGQLRAHEFRTATYPKPTAQYIGLFRASRGRWAPATAYSVGDYVIPTAANGRLYKCTTGGTSGGSEPSWGTVDGGTTNDNGVVWTEQSIALDASDFPEVAGGSYARVNVPPGDGNWSAPDNVAGLTDNIGAITFPAPTADWGLVVGFFTADAPTGGNKKIWGMLTAPRTVSNGNDAPSFPAGSLDIIYS